VVVEFDIRGDGSVDEDSVKILSSDPPRQFDREVQKAVVRWRFTPAPDGDRTRRRTFEQTFNFRVEGG
jgi:protein TonB